MAPRKRGALSQQQFNQLTSNLLDLNTGSVGLPFTDTKINVPSAAPLSLIPGAGDALLFGTIVGRTQAENIANRLAGNEPLGLMESMKRAGTGTGALGNLRQEVVEYQKSKGVENPNFITKTALTDFFANSPKYASLDVAPSSIGGKTQPFSTRSGFKASGFAGNYQADSPFNIAGEKGEPMTYEEAILSGRFDDDIKTTGEFASDNIYQTNIRGGVDPRTGKQAFDPAFSRAVTLENRGVKQSDPDPGDSDKSIICTEMYRQTGLDDWSKAMKIWYIYQKKYLTPLHQEGYHFLFRPFVNGMKRSKIITAIGNHLAKRRTNHIKHILFKKKPDYLGMIYMKIAEPLVYVVGKIRRHLND
tara:strand:- start:377 stop:1456 length:1080 start_codon:yes stop_codon:yes gene_type:complete